MTSIAKTHRPTVPVGKIRIQPPSVGSVLRIERGVTIGGRKKSQPVQRITFGPDSQGRFLSLTVHSFDTGGRFPVLSLLPFCSQQDAEFCRTPAPEIRHDGAGKNQIGHKFCRSICRPETTACAPIEKRVVFVVAGTKVEAESKRNVACLPLAPGETVLERV